jgi:hypothetical protein
MATRRNVHKGARGGGGRQRHLVAVVRLKLKPHWCMTRQHASRRPQVTCKAPANHHNNCMQKETLSAHITTHVLAAP